MDSAERELVFDPTALDRRQRAARACVVCRKAWPLPEVAVGRLPDLTKVFACRPCADALPATLEEALARKAAQDAGVGPVVRTRAARPQAWAWLRWPRQRQA